MVLIGLTDGDGTVTTSPDSTSGDSSNDDETTFDPDTQTLGTTSLGTTQDSGDDAGITVEESDADPSDSSPAGGAGAEEAVERFAGLVDEALADSTTEEMQNAVDAATGGSDSSDSGGSEEIGRTGKAAAALLVGAALVGRS